MKKITLLIISLLLTLSALADDRQFYFIAKEARLGSISNDAKNERGIYLRWDLIEGEMPSEIKKITLIRIDDDTNTTLLSIDSDAIMSESNITESFLESGSERRLFETIDFISNSDSPNCTGANISNFASTITSCLEENYWSFLASRVNFNVAQVRYRAYLDRDYDSSKTAIEYVLLAQNADKTKSFVLGRAEVPLTFSQSVLEAVDFKQIITSHCNDNRYGLDDAKMALYWKNGGENDTEFFANGLMISGYDLFYSTKAGKVQNPGKIDIATLASNSPHNAQGEVDLTSSFLAKANDTLVTLGEKDANSSQPIFVQSQQEIQEQGFKPGETRYYFLVPRDFTGNYGPTVWAEVIVPDLLPPPKPIYPRVMEENGEAKLVWNSVNFANYSAHYKNSLKACSVLTIANGDRVRFVDAKESCLDDNGIVVNFNVSKYLVYRFASATEAAGFEDLDLDGYNDANESLDERCSPSSGLGLDNYLVQEVQQSSNRTISFTDENVQQGKVYWYKVKSVTPSGVSSQTTAPIRVFVPKREILPALDMNVTHQVTFIQTQENTPSQDSLIAEDTTHHATSIQLLLGTRTYEFPINPSTHKAFIDEDFKDLLLGNTNIAFNLLFLKGDEVLANQYTKLSATFSLKTIRETIETTTYVECTPQDEKNYPDKCGEQTSYKEIITGYQILNTDQYFVLKEEQRVLVDGTPVIGGCVNITFAQSFIDTYQNKGCIETTISMGNFRYRKSRECNLTKVQTLCEESLNGDLVSTGVYYLGYNGIRSQQKFINFVPQIGATATPHQPSLIDLDINVDDNNISVSFRPQIEKVTGTTFTLYNSKDSNKTFTKIVTHIGESDPDKVLFANFNDIGEISTGDTWCVKAKTIGIYAEMSDWSSVVCSTLNEDTVPEDVLAWPTIETPSTIREALNAKFNTQTQKVEIELASQDASLTEKLGYSVIDTEYSSLIAEDLVGSSVTQLLLEFRKGDSFMLRFYIPKVNNEFHLNYEDIHFGSAEDIPRVTSVVITFLDQSGKEVLEPVTITKKNELFVRPKSSSRIVTSQKVVIDTMSLEDKCTMINHVTNFVVYRQTLYDGEQSSKFVQVSPLIQRATCDEDKDKYIHKSNNLSLTNNGTKRTVSFVDMYPSIAGEKYHYVLLFFNQLNGEPVSYGLTQPESIQVD